MSRYASERAARTALARARSKQPGERGPVLEVRSGEQISSRLEWDANLGRTVVREGPPGAMRAARTVPGQLSLLAECLDDRDRAVLAFARQHHLSGQVRQHVQAELGMSETRYFQLLLALLERPEVADTEPQLVAELRALLQRRRRWRSSTRVVAG